MNIINLDMKLDLPQPLLSLPPRRPHKSKFYNRLIQFSQAKEFRTISTSQYSPRSDFNLIQINYDKQQNKKIIKKQFLETFSLNSIKKFRIIANTNKANLSAGTGREKRIKTERSLFSLKEKEKDQRVMTQRSSSFNKKLKILTLENQTPSVAAWRIKTKRVY